MLLDATSSGTRLVLWVGGVAEVDVPEAELFTLGMLWELQRHVGLAACRFIDLAFWKHLGPLDS